MHGAMYSILYLRNKSLTIKTNLDYSKRTKSPLCIGQINTELGVISITYLAVDACESVEIITGHYCVLCGVVFPSIALCIGIAC